MLFGNDCRQNYKKRAFCFNRMLPKSIDNGAQTLLVTLCRQIVTVFIDDINQSKHRQTDQGRG